jgi:biopolymer transport protein ExbD
MSSDKPPPPEKPTTDKPTPDRGKEPFGAENPFADKKGPPSSAGKSSRPPPVKASTVKYKAALRKAIRKNAREPDIDFLNITAMLDMMTIILVFLLQSMASSSASIQENDDLKLSRSVMTGDPSDQGVILVISKTAILLGEEADPVVRLPAREQLVQGLDARFKRSGPSDLYIVPLANRLSNARRLDKAVRAAKGLDASTSEAIIIADAQTPYRLLIEVLYTLGQSEFGKYHIMVMKKAS